MFGSATCMQTGVGLVFCLTPDENNGHIVILLVTYLRGTLLVGLFECVLFTGGGSCMRNLSGHP